MNLRLRLARWLMQAAMNEVNDKPVEIVSSTRDPLGDNTPETTLAVVKAVNGTLIRVSQYKPIRGPGPDWHHELYIVKDDEKVADVIARVLAIKSLES